MGKKKLTPKQREEVRKYYNGGKGASKSALARWYGVSRGTITFIVEPDKEEANRLRNRERMRNKRNG